MKPTEQPGFLGDRLGDQQISLPDHLKWNVVGQQIAPPEPEPRRRKFFWWVLALLLIGSGLMFWPGQTDGPSSLASDRPATAQPPRVEREATSRFDKLATSESGQRNAPLATSSATTIPATEDTTYHTANPQADMLAGATAEVPQTNPFIAELPPLKLPVNTEPKAEKLVEQLNNERTMASEVARGKVQPAKLTKATAVVSAANFRSGSVPDVEQPAAVSRAKSISLIPTIPLRFLDASFSLPTIKPSLARRRPATTQYLQLSLGTARYGESLPDFEQLYDPQLRLSWWLQSRSGWQFSAGLQLGVQSWRTSLTRREETQLYRPGTPDTLYRNITTGEERLVTTDTISGMLETRFTGYGQLQTLSAPLLIGYRFPCLGGSLGINAGLAPGIVIRRNGRSLNSEQEIVAVEAALKSDFFLQYTAGVQYDFSLSRRLDVLAGAEFSWSGKGLFSGLGSQSSWHRLQLQLGMRLRVSR